MKTNDRVKQYRTVQISRHPRPANLSAPADVYAACGQLKRTVEIKPVLRGTVVTPDQVIENGTVLISGDKIQAAESCSQ
jgi:hypothetical protein